MRQRSSTSRCLDNATNTEAHLPLQGGRRAAADAGDGGGNASRMHCREELQSYPSLVYALYLHTPNLPTPATILIVAASPFVSFHLIPPHLSSSHLFRAKHPRRNPRGWGPVIYFPFFLSPEIYLPPFILRYPIHCFRSSYFDLALSPLSYVLPQLPFLYLRHILFLSQDRSAVDAQARTARLAAIATSGN